MSEDKLLLSLMFYTVNLGSLIKVFNSPKYQFKRNYWSTLVCLSKKFTNDDIMSLPYSWTINTSNYISFKNENTIEQNLEQLKHLSNIYNYFGINSTTNTKTEKTINISAYQPNDNVCMANNGSELILDENKPS